MKTEEAMALEREWSLGHVTYYFVDGAVDEEIR